MHDILTSREAADILGMSYASFRQLCHADPGRMPRPIRPDVRPPLFWRGEVERIRDERATRRNSTGRPRKSQLAEAGVV